MSEKARLFFALWPDERTRAQFSDWVGLLAPTIEGRPTKPESLHLTLVFLGDVELDRLDRLNGIAEKIDVRPFELAFGAPEYWRHNRIVHGVPLETPEALKNLVAVLERELRAAGLDFDERSYVPHMTLMRRARWRALTREFKPVNWKVTDFVLARSNRSRYEIAGRWPLNRS